MIIYLYITYRKWNICLLKLRCGLPFYGKIMGSSSFWNLHFILTSSHMIQRLLIIKGPSHSHQGEEWHKRSAWWQEKFIFKVKFDFQRSHSIQMNFPFHLAIIIFTKNYNKMSHSHQSEIHDFELSYKASDKIMYKERT
jgi:hypothetical protein